MSQTKVDYTYHAKLVRVIDGDTIECDIDFGFKLHQLVPVRLAHINAPEHNTAEGQSSLRELTALIGDSPLILKTFKPKDKYGRFLAEVYTDLYYINDEMRVRGFAVAYEGGER